MDVFTSALGEGPVRILGEPVAERPELPRFDDPRQGPARALAGWAARETAAAPRWWVVACDQVQWEPEELRAWHAAAAAADPAGEAWVLAALQGEPQPLGGFLGGTLLGALAGATEQRLLRLAASLPQRVLPWRSPPFLDVDDRAAAAAWLQGRRAGEG